MADDNLIIPVITVPTAPSWLKRRKNLFRRQKPADPF